VLGEDTAPPLLRVSDEDRDKAIELLRHGTAVGRLSNETFVQRVDVALRAQNLDELAAVLRDLPAPGRRGEWLVRSVHWFSALGWRLRQAWSVPRTPALALPRGDRVFVIGRCPDCDLTLANMTVSWRHAEFRPSQDDWMLVDLDSTNGTHVNGWRAGTGFRVRPGDRVRFGTVRFRIID
jgi:Domain of unknown function (DUF1707)/FHA domain